MSADNVALLMVISDLCGLVGGILLAIPAIHTQRIRDDGTILADAQFEGDGAREAKERATRAYEGVILRLARRDLTLAAWGTSLLALAFLLKLLGEFLILTGPV